MTSWVLVSCKERSLQQCGCWMLYRRCIGCKGWSTSGSFWLCRFCCLQCCYRLLHEELNDPTTTSIADSCDTLQHQHFQWNIAQHPIHVELITHPSPYIQHPIQTCSTLMHPSHINIHFSLYCNKRPCIIYLFVKNEIESCQYGLMITYRIGWMSNVRLIARGLHNMISRSHQCCYCQ